MTPAWETWSNTNNYSYFKNKNDDSGYILFPCNGKNLKIHVISTATSSDLDSIRTHLTAIDTSANAINVMNYFISWGCEVFTNISS